MTKKKMDGKTIAIIVLSVLTLGTVAYILLKPKPGLAPSGGGDSKKLNEEAAKTGMAKSVMSKGTKVNVRSAPSSKSSGNIVGQIPDSGTLLGTLMEFVNDADGTKDPVTGMTFVWAHVKADASLGSAAKDFYVRGDLAMVK